MNITDCAKGLHVRHGLEVCPYCGAAHSILDASIALGRSQRIVFEWGKLS